MAINFFSVGSVGDGTSVTSTIDQAALVAAISSDTYFDSTNKLGYVIVYYTHQDGRQMKKLVHRLDPTNNLTVSVLWTNDARDGTWEKTQVRVYDKEGAEHNMTRADIGTLEDLTHSGGVMTLNT